MVYQLGDIAPFDLSVALQATLDRKLGEHLHKPGLQEDCAFAYWRPSEGATRYTAIVTEVVWPLPGDRTLQGNVAFLPEYLERVLGAVPPGCGIAFMHGHLGPGWQGMSQDDVIAERDRLAGAVAGVTGLPLVGLTRGTDGAWGGRFWVRAAPRLYQRLEARTVRVVGRTLRSTFHPGDAAVPPTAALGETATVWGSRAQQQLVRTRIGIVGLGSVGSMVAEALSRMGLSRLTYIDHDSIEMRNLDRTCAATPADVLAGLSKVAVAGRATTVSHTASAVDLRLIADSVLRVAGYRAALDCDVLVSAVDRPLPRHLLNSIAYSHLIPVVDGGIMARVKSDGTPLNVDWRIQTAGPDHPCLACSGALRRSDVALDRDGKLDDPDYIAGLPEAERDLAARRNVFPFSMSVAAHQVLQLVGLVTDLERIGGSGPQMYHAYPGIMEVSSPQCVEGCEYQALVATAGDVRQGL